MISKAMHSSKTSEWGTPPEFFRAIDHQFHFDLDVCATDANAKCARYFTKRDHALHQRWTCRAGWMNPPYGKHDEGILAWMGHSRRTVESGHAQAMVSLVPVRTGSVWWRTTITRPAQFGDLCGRLLHSSFGQDTIRLWFRRLLVVAHFVEGRLKFTGQAGDSAPFDSALVVFQHPDFRAGPRMIATGLAEKVPQV